MTAPMKLEKSATSPMRSSATWASSRSRSSGHMLFGAYTREAAEHFLALVLERATHDRGRDLVDVGGGVGDDEVRCRPSRRRCAEVVR